MRSVVSCPATWSHALPELRVVSPEARTGSARFRAQVTGPVPPVPKTEGSVPWGRGGADKFLLARCFPSPWGEGQGEG
jgi:hypothetical protein